MPRRLTMADIRHASLRSGSPYFSRETTRYWGPEKFWGPYEGPGGVYFVKKNKAGISIEKFHRENGRIHNVDSMLSHVEDARERAKELARNAARDPRRRTASSPARRASVRRVRSEGDTLTVREASGPWIVGRNPRGHYVLAHRNPHTKKYDSVGWFGSMSEASAALRHRSHR